MTRITLISIKILIFFTGLFVHPIFWIGLIFLFYLYYLHYGWKELWLPCIVILIFYSCSFYPQKNISNYVRGEIIVLKEKNIIVSNGRIKTIIYGDFSKYNLKDWIEVEVKPLKILPNTNENGFNYQLYLKSKGIINSGSLVKIIKVKKNNHLLASIYDYLNEDDRISPFSKMFILGLVEDDIKEFYDKGKQLSIVYLFALSGMHLSVLKKILVRWLNFFVNEKYLEYIILGIIGLYIYIIPFNVSFMRAYLMMVFSFIFKDKLSKLEILGLVSSIFIFFNPYIIFNISYIFSFSIYFFLLIIGDNKYLFFYLYLGSIPLLLNLQYRLNIVGFIIGIGLSPFISVFYELLLYTCVFKNLLGYPMNILIDGLSNIINFGNDFSFFINFSKPNLFFILAYYYIYFRLILRVSINRKSCLLLIKLLIVLSLFYYQPYFSLSSQVTMIDVGQGDCFLIKQAYGGPVIMIDTGGLYNIDVAKEIVVPYLRSQGVNKLDYLLISHNDFDHVGGLNSLQKEIKINNIIRSYQPTLKIGNVIIEMLSVDKKFIKENDNSLIFIVRLNKLKYLFLGDISKEVEKLLYEKYHHLDIDVLKVAHHGSKTSTSPYLFLLTRPKVALISVGRNNIYKHPNKEVIDQLKSYGLDIYQTNRDGMVKIVSYPWGNYIYKTINN